MTDEERENFLNFLQAQVAQLQANQANIKNEVAMLRGLVSAIKPPPLPPVPLTFPDEVLQYMGVKVDPGTGELLYGVSSIYVENDPRALTPEQDDRVDAMLKSQGYIRQSKLWVFTVTTNGKMHSILRCRVIKISGLVPAPTPQQPTEPEKSENQIKPTTIVARPSIHRFEPAVE